MYSGLFTLCLMWFCTAFVLAASEYTEGYFKYRIEDSSVTIYEYFGSEKEVTVPSLIAGNPVNVIAAGAFSSESGVEKVNLPDSIMTIERNAIGQGIQVVYNSNTDNPIKSGSDQLEEISGDDEKKEKEIAESKNRNASEENEREFVSKKNGNNIDESENTENTENIGKTRNEHSSDTQIENRNTEKINIDIPEENTGNNTGKEVDEKNNSGLDEVEISLDDSFESKVDKGNTIETLRKDNVIILVVLCLIIIGIGGLWYYKKKRKL